MSMRTDVLIVGGGPAGISAASVLGRSGLKVLLAEQASTLGGVVFRGGAEVHKNLLPHDLRKTWSKLQRDLSFCADDLELSLETTFVGMDATGVAVLKDRRTGRTYSLKPKAIVLATGAVERVDPVPGWHLPGVITVGGLQVNLKATGRPPKGDVLLAGSGPLLLAVASQLVKLGRPPVAIIEAGYPVRRSTSAFGLPVSYIKEGAAYLSRITRARVPWLRGAHIEEIRSDRMGFSVLVSHRQKWTTYHTDFITLHNGLRSNDFGLPLRNTDPRKEPIVVYAGDCGEVLGVRAAPISGRVAASQVLVALDQRSSSMTGDGLARQRKAQSQLSEIFVPATKPGPLPDDTILCRCEQKTVADLARFAAKPSVSAREVKLNGRFGLGRCQGRFCAENTLQLLERAHRVAPAIDDFVGRRWPVKPVRVKDLAKLEQGE